MKKINFNVSVIFQFLIQLLLEIKHIQEHNIMNITKLLTEK